MIGDNVNNIKSKLYEITKILTEIQEENDEHIEDLVNYACSTEVNVGGRLCRYGEIYKLVFYSTDFDDIIYKLETLYWKDKYEGYEEDMQKIQDMFIKGVKEGKKFELGVKEEVLFMLEHEYIFETILKCL